MQNRIERALTMAGYISGAIVFAPIVYFFVAMFGVFVAALVQSI